MSIDFPRAWQLTKNSNIEDHHGKCSWKVAGLLCDCGFLNKHPELLSSTFYGHNGKVITPANRIIV